MNPAPQRVQQTRGQSLIRCPLKPGALAGIISFPGGGAAGCDLKRATSALALT